MKRHKKQLPAPAETHLGCGVYAANDRGEVIKLRAVCEETGADQAIYLDATVGAALIDFMKKSGWSDP